MKYSNHHRNTYGHFRRRIVALCISTLFSSFLLAQSGAGTGGGGHFGDAAAIRKVMSDQAEAWNKGSIDDFMKGYWNSDSLLFVGHAGITYGYANALANYKKSYGNQDQMGQLFFTLLSIKRLSSNYYFVTGKWFLKRKAGDIGGIYTLLFRKVDGRWVIVADHTS